MLRTHVQVFDGPRVAALDGHRQPVLLESATEIVPGDWLRDLGTLREVKSIETLPGDGVRGVTVIAHFAQLPGIPDLALGIRAEVKVTVWRVLAGAAQ